jgi:hypothetical protein
MAQAGTSRDSASRARDITRRAAVAGLGCCALATWPQQDGDVVTAIAGSRVRFAAPEMGRSLLMAEDEWTAATSEFQRRAVMNSATPVTLDAFRRWNGDAVRPWSAAQRARWLKALDELAPGFAALRIPLPGEVWLVATNGQESAAAPYTRGNAVMLAGAASMPGYSDGMLLAHELWHVASRHAPDLATRLYAEIGFEPVPQLVFPAAWAALRIANPDAPNNRHAMRLRVQDRDAWLTPVLVASRTTLQPGETFFSVMEVRLLELEPGAGVSRAVLRGDQPVWHALDAPHDYVRRLGGNTDYVIHPEEAMADNVALLANGLRALNPELLGRIRAVFESPR